ncbi:hypothetical protein [Methylobacterium sp. 1030]|uniref:hypothetical protein n=1 Tax=Methylobacterium sp. 1030 TaxID=3156404 RepID=UPI0033908D3E
MQFFSPAITSTSRARAPGDFVLIDGGDGVHPAVFVHNGQSMYVLDFMSVHPEGDTRFAIHTIDSFNYDTLLHVPNARIVPTIVPEKLVRGRPEGFGRSKVLYLSESGPLVYAHFMRSSACINLSTGVIANVDTAYELHTTQWRIEVGVGDGHYQTLADFTA